MGSGHRVLLLTRSDDAHVLPVEEELRRRGGEVLRCNLADFPAHLTLSARLDQGWHGMLTTDDGQIVALETLRSIWWRRPLRYCAPKTYPPEVRVFVEREASRELLGVLHGLQAFWVSPPDAIQHAESKPLQLVTAHRLGLRVPRTLITNDPADVRAFYGVCHGRIMSKAVARGSIDGPPGTPRFLYTNRVSLEDLAHLDGVRATAHLFQMASITGFNCRCQTTSR